MVSYSRKRARDKYTPKAEKLVDQIREVMRFHHYAYRTEQTYVDWIVRYVKFHGTVHPRTLGQADVEKYLSYLAQVQNVAVSTQNQAFNAILFLSPVTIVLFNALLYDRGSDGASPSHMDSLAGGRSSC